MQAALRKLGATEEHIESIGEEDLVEGMGLGKDAQNASETRSPLWALASSLEYSRDGALQVAGNAADPGDVEATAVADGAANGSVAESSAAAPAPKRRLRQPTTPANAQCPGGTSASHQSQIR